MAKRLVRRYDLGWARSTVEVDDSSTIESNKSRLGVFMRGAKEKFVVLLRRQTKPVKVEAN